MKRIVAIAVSVFLCFCSFAFRQNDTIVIIDSAEATTAQKAVELIIKADSLALADSLNRAVLSKQFEEL
jgi:hypothetical protein